MAPRGHKLIGACFGQTSPGLLPAWLGDPGTERLMHTGGFIIVSMGISVYESFFTDEDFLWVKLVALRIKRKYNGLLFAALTSVVMSLIITFILVLVNNGWTERFWEMWLRGFIVGSLVSIPISLVVIPAVKKMVDKLASA